jgi:hypothetical protein
VPGTSTPTSTPTAWFITISVDFVAFAFRLLPAVGNVAGAGSAGAALMIAAVMSAAASFCASRRFAFGTATCVAFGDLLNSCVDVRATFLAIDDLFRASAVVAGDNCSGGSDSDVDRTPVVAVASSSVSPDNTASSNVLSVVDESCTFMFEAPNAFFFFAASGCFFGLPAPGIFFFGLPRFFPRDASGASSESESDDPESESESESESEPESESRDDLALRFSLFLALFFFPGLA